MKESFCNCGRCLTTCARKPDEQPLRKSDCNRGRIELMVTKGKSSGEQSITPLNRVGIHAALEVTGRVVDDNSLRPRLDMLLSHDCVL